jgi:hypothetical protein
MKTIVTFANKRSPALLSEQTEAIAVKPASRPLAQIAAYGTDG